MNIFVHSCYYAPPFLRSIVRGNPNRQRMPVEIGIPNYMVRNRPKSSTALARAISLTVILENDHGVIENDQRIAPNFRHRNEKHLSLSGRDLVGCGDEQINPCSMWVKIRVKLLLGFSSPPLMIFLVIKLAGGSFPNQPGSTLLMLFSLHRCKVPLHQCKVCSPIGSMTYVLSWKGDMPTTVFSLFLCCVFTSTVFYFACHPKCSMDIPCAGK